MTPEVERDEIEAKVPVIKLTKLQRGEKKFISTGVSRVKITKDSEVTCLEIPIQSTGISELLDSFRKDSPLPPLTKQKVDPKDPSDELAKDLGVTKRTWIKIPDYSDPTYVKEKEQHNSDMGIAILLKGMVLEVCDEDGAVIINDDEKIEVLKEAGMSGDQFQQIIDDITSLTKWTDEEKVNFFG